jgi:uncharacterized protein YdiU (UPF0061 family)
MKHDPRHPAASPRAPFPFDNSYARLPQTFFARQTPSHAEEPWLIKLNEPLAEELGLDVEVLKRDGADIFSGNLLPDGADPLAMAYAGHQFGSFVPQLGDGRAILLGEVIDTTRQTPRHPAEGCGRDAVSHGVVTDGRRSGRCSGSISSAKRCTRSACRRHGR